MWLSGNGVMTQSEANTIELFSLTSFELSKIQEEDEKTPDFVLKNEHQDIFIEVKEISENPEELLLSKKVDEQGFSGIYDSPEVGKRFRSKIAEANRQLRKRCVDGQSGIVIIQDVRPFLSMSMMPQEEIKQAMFGERVTWVSVQKQTKKLNVEADLFSKNKTTTPNKNTTVSAVGLLMKHSETSIVTLHVFHNPHAKNKLTTRLSIAENIKEYWISDTNNYQEFMGVKTT
jgi:hypothetical protein